MGKKPSKNLTIRNSTAEFLIFTRQSGEGGIEVRYEDETIWLTQKLMAELFSTAKSTISEHLGNIYASGELTKNSTVRKFRTVQREGNRDVERDLDYNRDAPTTREFFARVQNKLHYAIHGHTAAELIQQRADGKKKNMGLTSWENSPDGKILKSDVSVAKNYLSKEELESLGRIVNAYIDLAEDRAQRKIPMTMEDWSKRLDIFLEAFDRQILQDSGRVSAEIAKTHAESEFEKYRVVQDRLFESDFDRETKRLEQQLSRKDGDERDE